MKYIDTDKIFKAHPYAYRIMEKLENLGFEAVLIGGVVRDAVREKLNSDYKFKPDDIDIATSARPDEIKEIFEGHKIVEVGKKFGVLMLVSPEGKEYEVASFREEGRYDGRWPAHVNLVRNLKSDIERRDLTINGLAAARDGKLIDYVGGIKDLKNQVIDTIGDPYQRFKEDYLRLLRTIRLACYIDGTIQKEVTEAIKKNVQKLEEISSERIRDELIKIFETRRSAKGFKLMDEQGILELILPEVTALKGVKQPEKYHLEGDVFEHTIYCLEIADNLKLEPMVKLGLLLHDIGKPEALVKNRGEHMGGHSQIGVEKAQEICRRLHLSNEQRKLIRYLVGQHMRIADFSQMNRGKQVMLIKEGENPAKEVNDISARFPLFTKLLKLLICDCEASSHKASGWLPVLKKTTEVMLAIQELDQLADLRELINGHDILRMGVEEGPKVGEILENVHRKILAGQIKTRQEALEEATQYI